MQNIFYYLSYCYGSSGKVVSVRPIDAWASILRVGGRDPPDFDLLGWGRKGS